MDAPKKILVLSVSAGAGHLRAADALIQTAEKNSANLILNHVDIMTCVPKWFRKVYCDTYLELVKRHPKFWGYLYDKTDHGQEDSKFNRWRRRIENLNTKKLRLFIKKENPSAVICTHFLPAQVLSLMLQKKQLNIPVWVQITDYDVHGLWVHPHIEGYFVAHAEMAHRLKAKGVPQERVHVTGIAISPPFQGSLNKHSFLLPKELRPDCPTLLLMSGGAGLNDLQMIAKALLELPERFQLVAVAGRNENLYKRLKRLAKSANHLLVPLKFTPEIEQWMQASTLAITKPGGLTTAECLAIGLPLLIVSPIPGQEERNADYLLEKGAALKAHDLPGIVYRVQNLLNNPKECERLAGNARRLGKPRAAASILKRVEEDLYSRLSPIGGF